METKPDLVGNINVSDLLNKEKKQQPSIFTETDSKFDLLANPEKSS